MENNLLIEIILRGKTLEYRFTNLERERDEARRWARYFYRRSVQLYGSRDRIIKEYRELQAIRVDLSEIERLKRENENLRSALGLQDRS